MIAGKEDLGRRHASQESRRPHRPVLSRRAVTDKSSRKPEFGTVRDASDEGAGDFTFILSERD
jgi:hypothetical protein